MERFGRYFGAVWIVFIAALITFYGATRRTELENIGQVIRSTDPRWILLAGCFEFLILMLMAKMFQSLFFSLGHRVPLYAILSAYLRGLAAAAIVPFGGPVAVIIFTRALARRNVPINDAVYVSALASLSGFASFLIMMIPLLSLLYLTGDLPAIFVTATLVLAALFVVALGVMSILLRWGGPPSWLSRHIPHYLRDFVRQARSHRLTVNDVLRPLGFSLCVDLCGALMLYTSLVSVGERSGMLAAFGAYQVEMLFNVVAPFFQGFGIADLSITVALNSLGISVSSAATATLIYRIWDLWVPLLIGATLHLTNRRLTALRSRFH